MSVISVDDFLVFCRRTVAGMDAALVRLGDDLVNDRPDLPGANSAFQIVTHAIGATRWWCLHIVLGRPSDRVRGEEFTARGSVDSLRFALADLLDGLDAAAPALSDATALAHPAATETPLEGEWTVGAALLHAYEELAQHLGHLEITVDLISRGR